MDGYNHVLRHNVSWTYRDKGHVTNYDKATCTFENNSFLPQTTAFTVTADMFVSTSPADMVVKRNADGTLPEGTLMEPYMKPQTTGDRLVYNVTLTDAKGHGWQIECPEGIYFSANRYTDADLMNAQHTWDIKARPYIWLQLGMDIRGLGNASCGPGPMHKYVIDGKQTYEFRVRMKKI